MKFFKIFEFRIYTILSILLIFSINIIISKKSKNFKNKPNEDSSIKKLETQINSLKEQLKIETLKNSELTKKLKDCAINNGIKEFRSFLETEIKSKTDPLFKVMSMGFPSANKVSYTGLDRDENMKFSELVRCPKGCVVN